MPHPWSFREEIRNFFQPLWSVCQYDCHETAVILQLLQASPTSVLSPSPHYYIGKDSVMCLTKGCDPLPIIFEGKTFSHIHQARDNIL